MSDSPSATNPSHRGYPYFPGYFWDHYTEHPDIYDRFAVSTDVGVDWLASLVGLSGDVLDMASGTGRTALCAARSASSVVGIEPAAPMRTYAIRKRDQVGAVNVEFLEGSTFAMPVLPPQSFDLVMCFHGPPFSPAEVPAFVDALAPLTRPGGHLVIQCTTPQWLPEFQKGLPFDSPVRRMVSDPNRDIEHALVEHGFRFEDTTLYADHGSLEDALASYGFIYGPLAIDWLLDGQHSKIPWGMRSYLLRV